MTAQARRSGRRRGAAAALIAAVAVAAAVLSVAATAADATSVGAATAASGPHHRHHHRHRGRHRKFRFVGDEPAAGDPTPVPAAAPAAAASAPPPPTAPVAGDSGGQQIPWVTLMIVAGCLALTVILCFVFRKQVPVAIHYTEQGCHGLYVLVKYPLKLLRDLLVVIIYPVKQAVVGVYTSCYEYYHPYTVTS